MGSQNGAASRFNSTRSGGTLRHHAHLSAILLKILFPAGLRSEGSLLFGLHVDYPQFQPQVDLASRAARSRSRPMDIFALGDSDTQARRRSQAAALRDLPDLVSRQGAPLHQFARDGLHRGGVPADDLVGLVLESGQTA